MLICIAGVALGTDREFGHPLFRTFNAHDYGEVGQVFSVTEDPQGPMLFGCEDAIMVFDNNRWETIRAPGTGYIRSFATDSRGVVWFTSSTQIGYLSKVDGKYRVVKVYDGSLGIGSHVIVDGDRLYFASKAGLLEWNDGRISQHPWPTDAMTPFSSAVSHGKIWVADEAGSLYEFDGRGFNKIAESPTTSAGDVRSIVVAAESTEQALSLLKDSFDALISDIRMPGGDGHTFCRRLRSADETKNLIMIASSASVFADDQRRALASGFNGFLPKPVMEEELFEILGIQLELKWVYAGSERESDDKLSS